MAYFVTFEGGEGAGKSTQIDRLRRRVENLGHPVLLTREPGGSEKAEQIRGAILSGSVKAFGAFAEALLFSAARLDHLERTIRPALDNGVNVFCDRFADSTRAYQGALGNVDSKTIAILERVVVDGTEPDLTFILDVPAEVGLARARQRQEDKRESSDRFEAEALSFHRSLRQAFLDIGAANPHRCVVVDATQDPDQVDAAIWQALQARLPGLTVPAKASSHVA
jgi:dTMP kinase